MCNYFGEEKVLFGAIFWRKNRKEIFHLSFTLPEIRSEHLRSRSLRLYAATAIGRSVTKNCISNPVGMILFHNDSVITQEPQLGNNILNLTNLKQVFSWAFCGKVNNLRTHLQGDHIMATHSQNEVATKIQKHKTLTLLNSAAEFHKNICKLDL